MENNIDSNITLSGLEEIARKEKKLETLRIFVEYSWIDDKSAKKVIIYNKGIIIYRGFGFGCEPLDLAKAFLGGVLVGLRL